MEAGVTKNGYSIWSLLVIMTLLAVWLAIPRTVSIGKWPDSVLLLFIVFHQLTLWTLVGYGIWLVTGRRRIVVYMVAGILTIFWGPLVLITAERSLFNSEYVVAWTVQTGLADVLDPLYSAISRSFNYEP